MKYLISVLCLVGACGAPALARQFCDFLAPLSDNSGSYENATCLSGVAVAYAGALGSFSPECEALGCTGGFDSDFDVSLGCSASANASAIGGTAIAVSTFASINGTSWSTGGFFGFFDCLGCCGEGAGFGYGSAQLVLQGTVMVSDFGGSLLPVQVGSTRVVSGAIFLVDGALLQCSYAIWSPNGCDASADVSASCGGSFSRRVGIGSGTLTVENRYLDFVDAELDLTSDGRFSQEDVDELSLLIGSMDSGLLATFDFDEDGVIGQPDVDVLQGLIDCGLGSGIFGDMNGDGLIRCADWDAATPWPTINVNLGEANYVVELDLNLDGTLDTAEQAAFEALFAGVPNPCSCPGDANGSNNVDLADLQIVQFNFGQFVTPFTSGDVTGDGVVNLADLQIVLFSFGSSC